MLPRNSEQSYREKECLVLVLRNCIRHNLGRNFCLQARHYTQRGGWSRTGTRRWGHGRPTESTFVRMNIQSHADAKQPDCLVRTPRPADYACMADLAEQLGYECTVAEIRERLYEMQDGNRYTVLVAELPGGRIVGWIGAYIFRSVETRSCAEISGLVVDRIARSCGIGRTLLHSAEEWARSIGCDTISVKSNIIRDRAHGFYTNNGYTHTKTQKEFRKDLSPRSDFCMATAVT